MMTEISLYDAHDPWVTINAMHRQQGDELLALTGFRDQKIKAHWLLADGSIAREQVRCSSDRFMTLTTILPEVAWDEREIYDLFGYTPIAHPDLRPLLRTQRWPDDFYPLRAAMPDRPLWRDGEPDQAMKVVQGEGIVIMKVGPTHAGIIESGHFVFSVMGENILCLDAHLFQKHRGIEALLQGKSFPAIQPMIARLCGSDSVSHQYNLLQSIEQVTDRHVSEVVQYRRILVAESERILSHLNDLAQIPAGVGFAVAHQKGLALKELWQRGMAVIFGHRFLFDAMYGEVFTQEDKLHFLSLITSFEALWAKWVKLTEKNVAFHDRMRGVGKVTRQDAKQLGAVGVARRATGEKSDMRKYMPLYQVVDFTVATALGGDVEARFQVRLLEVESSLSILRQTLARMGDPSKEEPFVVPSDLTGETVTFSESPHGLNVHVIQWLDGKIDRYHIRSGSYRNWPVLAKAVEGNVVADFPLINKSFELCYSCTDR